MLVLRTLVFIIVLFTISIGAQDKGQETPQLTEMQQMSLRIKELEAENAFLKYQLAQSQFEISRTNLQREIESNKRPGWRVDRIDNRWVLVPETPVSTPK